MIRRVIGSSATRQPHAPSHINNYRLSSCLHHFIASLSNDSIKAVPEIEAERKNCVTKRFVFRNSKITQLKAMATVGGLKNPTPVQVLSALIFKCTTAAENSAGSFRPPAALFKFSNAQPQMNPRLPQGNFIGNLRALSEQIKKRNMEGKGDGEEKVERNEIGTKKMFVLMDTQSGDGIEALVSLEEEPMAKFECHKQLLQFASLH